jgi:hypothetical protein
MTKRTRITGVFENVVRDESNAESSGHDDGRPKEVPVANPCCTTQCFVSVLPRPKQVPGVSAVVCHGSKGCSAGRELRSPRWASR